jgi:hypothetical protein
MPLPSFPRSTPTLARAAFARAAGGRTAAAQTEIGVVRDARTRAPLACMHVALLDSSGTEVGHTVTDSTGQFLLEAPRAGAYRVRFATYGWDPLAGPLDTLRQGDFRQRAYPVAFTNMVLPTLPVDGSAIKSLPANASLDRKTIDSLFAPSRAVGEWKRSLEDRSAWKSRRMNPESIQIRFPTGFVRQKVEGSAIARFVIDSAGRARPESFAVIDASQEEFGRALRGFLDGTWKPSTIDGRPTCDLAQYYVRFSIDARDPVMLVGNVAIMNE